eukprot:CAMPEP_0195290512 /NCGR_PEP_ID=MMETSP0707-20130614/6345_1 /TAXON_ID=33640 /ORGANISM="Asterionellopsis glacialis, Strain CCMP134" /LENGTH=437 /DNA_ID=CAMNT_0040350651 /DNA_START=180 /DNA_END=1493 /DNA_ORIENTATION=-
MLARTTAVLQRGIATGVSKRLLSATTSSRYHTVEQSCWSSYCSAFPGKSIHSLLWSSPKFSTAAFSTEEEEEDTEERNMIDYETRWHESYQRYKEAYASGDEQKSDMTPADISWIHHQRRLYHQRQNGQTNTTLTDERIRLLEELGGFEWTVHREWEESFELLQQFIEKNGHPNVTAGDDFRLNLWVHKQRLGYKQYQEKKPTVMNDTRIQKLESVGFNWDLHQQLWDKNYDQLKIYFEKEGHSNFPELRETVLGRWVHTQRRFEKMRQDGQKSAMTEERKKRLDQLNFVWDAHEAQWQSRYRELCEYQRAFGNCLVPRKWASNTGLAHWVDHQRYRHKKWKDGNGDETFGHRKALLDKIGFAWNAHDAAWERKYFELELHVQHSGPGTFPSSSANKSLYNWMKTQRRHHRNMKAGKKTSLTKERLQKLNKIGFFLT